MSINVILSELTGFRTLMDANDWESTNLPPMRLGTLCHIAQNIQCEII